MKQGVGVGQVTLSVSNENLTRETPYPDTGSLLIPELKSGPAALHPKWYSRVLLKWTTDSRRSLFQRPLVE